MSFDLHTDSSTNLTAGQSRSASRNVATGPYLTVIRALAGTAVKLIMTDDVCYFRAETKYTTVATADEQVIIRRPIKTLVGELDPDRFWRVHRSALVNVRAIRMVFRDAAGGMVVTFKDRPERLCVSEAHHHLFRHM